MNVNVTSSQMNPRRIVAGFVLVFAIAGCSSSQQTSAADSVKQLDAACTKVRELNAQVDALNLDDKGSAALDDPTTKALLDETAAATAELAKRVDTVATNNQGAVGKLKRGFDKNRKLINEISSFATSESKDSMADKARKLRKVADIIGADSCAK
jgi:outer membrane murein-binding lipoprotein Lpp